MSAYVVIVQGCDDSTEITVELSDAEVAIVRKVAAQITKASNFNCMPTMSVREPRADDEDGSS